MENPQNWFCGLDIKSLSSKSSFCFKHVAGTTKPAMQNDELYMSSY